MMGVILIVGAFFTTLHIQFASLIITIVYCVFAAKKSKERKYIPLKIITFIPCMFLMTLLTAWNYYLAYKMDYNFPGPGTEFWSAHYVMNMIPLLGMAIYANIIERFPDKKIWHGCFYTGMIIFLFL